LLGIEVRVLLGKGSTTEYIPSLKKYFCGLKYCPIEGLNPLTVSFLSYYIPFLKYPLLPLDLFLYTGMGFTAELISFLCLSSKMMSDIFSFVCCICMCLHLSIGEDVNF
jgi:hypothetical protein